MHVIEAVAEFHLRFENIHPFIDGNGRTGRLVMNFELMKAGLLPVNIKFADRRKYYDCFDDYYAVILINISALSWTIPARIGRLYARPIIKA